MKEFDMDAFFVGVAALAGILVGFWLRGIDARAATISLEQRNRDIADALAKSRADAERNVADTSARAAFESLSAEREKIIGQMATEQERLRADLNAKADSERTQTARVSELEADLRNERQKTSESLVLLETARQSLASQFEGLAAEAMEKRSQAVSGDGQGELFNLLTPLREQLSEFREKVEKAQLDSTSGVNRLETLIGALGGLNQQLAQEARNLSTALRGSAKAQGNWGEFVLRDLLEKAGLREGEQFTFQQSFSDAVFEDGQNRGAKQTDIIIHLPGGRHLVIDSKVSLNAFADSINAELEDDRKAAAGEHLRTLRSHAGNIAKANYHGLPGIQTPDFVMMFVPIEPAYLVALQSDPELWVDAYAKGVLLTGPTTLLYVIRIVSILWRQEDQNRAVREVTDYGSALYTKFAAFVSDMDSLGESLRNATARYDDAKNKLSDGKDSLTRQFEDFKQLGAQPRLAPSAETIPFKWLAAPVNDDAGLSFAAEDESERLELETGKAETNGYHHRQAEDLQIEEAIYPMS
jgi:DNA recombination protein RmuC